MVALVNMITSKDYFNGNNYILNYVVLKIVYISIIIKAVKNTSGAQCKTIQGNAGHQAGSIGS